MRDPVTMASEDVACERIVAMVNHIFMAGPGAVLKYRAAQIEALKGVHKSICDHGIDGALDSVLLNTVEYEEHMRNVDPTSGTEALSMLGFWRGLHLAADCLRP